MNTKQFYGKKKAIFIQIMKLQIEYFENKAK